MKQKMLCYTLAILGLSVFTSLPTFAAPTYGEHSEGFQYPNPLQFFQFDSQQYSWAYYAGFFVILMLALTPIYRLLNR